MIAPVFAGFVVIPENAAVQPSGFPAPPHAEVLFASGLNRFPKLNARGQLIVMPPLEMLNPGVERLIPHVAAGIPEPLNG